MKIHVMRLHPGDDIKDCLTAFVREKPILAGVIISCVGSISKTNIRLADEQYNLEDDNKYEILSLNGTLSKDGLHLHISLADSKGRVIGGHLLENNIIYTTAEIIIGGIDDTIFKRTFDPKTGFRELRVLGNYN